MKTALRKKSCEFLKTDGVDENAERLTEEMLDSFTEEQVAYANASQPVSETYTEEQRNAAMKACECAKCGLPGHSESKCTEEEFKDAEEEPPIIGLSPHEATMWIPAVEATAAATQLEIASARN